MNRHNEHCKCGTCGKALTSEPEKQQHAKTCTCEKKEAVNTAGTKEVVTAPNGRAAAVPDPVVAAPVVADAVARHPL